ncbi:MULTISPECIES: hypothetical protein [unclassified Rhodococcus (in: high G+C Gram-positive bacteria)]|uniref:hypothetical protein n=1 Tax=unclassified Rhodococcus (in: high G+C Gram-positive bacteria) TaxID=192944 RepID=UPI00117BBB14|nr:MULTISPECIES: hypothetical protein [unclassified Rhodococcus (in: high G+C Gram-positive bacteria)]
MGLVLISRVRDDYVLAWPVTVLPDPAAWPALRLPSADLHAELALWPVAETGLGRHLLHRRVGLGLSTEMVEEVRTAVRAGHTPPLEAFGGEQPVQPSFIAELLRQYQHLCFNEWPTDLPGYGVLRRDVLLEQGANLSQVRESLGVTVPDAASLLKQDRVPTKMQAELLADAWGLDVREILEPASGEWVRELRKPHYKDDLKAVGEARNLPELDVRLALQSEFALAARTATGTNRTAELMEDAVRRMKEGQ